MKDILLLIVTVNSIFVEGGLQPDIMLKGTSLTVNSSTVFQFICSTNIAVWQCSVEFLIEKMTHNYIQNFENKCYHTYGICSPNVCSCSDSCTSFTWNVTVTDNMQNHSYSCLAQMVTGEVKYLANITVKWDGKAGFQTIREIVVPIDTVTQQSTTPESESVKLIIISTSVGSIIGVLTFIVLSLTCRKFCRSKKNKAPPHIIKEDTIYHVPVQFDLITRQSSEITLPSNQNPNKRQISRTMTSYDRNPNDKHQDTIQLKRYMKPTPGIIGKAIKDEYRHQDKNFDDLNSRTINRNPTTKKSHATVSYSTKSDRNSTARKSPPPFSYSALSIIGNRSSTSTQSSGTSEEKIQYNLRSDKKKKRVIMRRNGLEESDA